MSICQNQVAFCKVKMCPCDCIGNEHECKFHKVDCGGARVPTFSQWIGIYLEAAKRRNEKNGKLESAVVRHIVNELNHFKKVMGFTDDDRIGVINRKSLKEYCDRLKCRNISKISKCNTIRQAFAKWTRVEFEDVCDIPNFDLPDIEDDSDRFREPSPELRLAVAKWYRDLIGRGKGKRKNRDRLFAMFMYRYGMRNGDVARLKWSNIVSQDGRTQLVYQPHKTRLTSKRFVKVWMSAMDVYDLEQFRNGVSDETYIFGGGKCQELCNRLNKELRAIGVTGSKGMYILRKLCIHTMFKKYGREVASAISGDDFETIKYHYADPDSINVRVSAEEL